MKILGILNGRIVDPAQNIDMVSNLYIENGKIKSITDEVLEADTVIDASGKIVCPGFIDIHMHEDRYRKDTGSIEKSMSLSALMMGVTTDIGGNCGENYYPPDAFLDITDRDGAPVNIGLFAGHGFLRSLGQPEDKYQPVSDEKIMEMVSQCKKYLDAGCVGVSFGVKYIPGTTWEEMMALVSLCKEQNKMVSSHVRQDVEGVFDAADELARMGREGNVKVQFSHIGSMGGYGQMEELLNRIKKYRDDDIDMLCDCYPYTAFSTSIGATTYDDGFLERYESDYDAVMVASGKYRGQRCTKEIFDELRKNAPETATVGYFMKEEDVDLALLSDLVMIGSDGFRRDGTGHPRASGAFPRFINRYIKSGKIDLMKGIYKMTTAAANRLGLKEKGNFLPGSDGDVVVFDLNRTRDLATFEDDCLPPEGIEWVIIGGEVALKDGRVIRDNLGKSIRLF